MVKVYFPYGSCVMELDSESFGAAIYVFESKTIIAESHTKQQINTDK